MKTRKSLLASLLVATILASASTATEHQVIDLNKAVALHEGARELKQELKQRWRQLQIAAFQSDIGVKTWELKAHDTPAADRDGFPVDQAGETRQGYTLAAGSVIPALLITGLNSDLPGYLTAQVSENVFDSPTGKILLIPQGSRLFGEYDSKIIFGQRRPLIRWSRLTFPDGSTLDLEGMPGTDKSGYAGFRAGVNSHYGPMLATAILVSIFSGVAEAIDRDKEGNSLTISQPTITLSDSVPVGMIMLRMGAVAPTDWHVLDGSPIADANTDDEFRTLAGTAKNFPVMNAAPGYVWCVKIRSSKTTLLNSLARSGINATNATVKDSAGRYIGAELAEAVSRMANVYFEKQLSRAPTLVVKPGYRFHVMVNRALKLPAWKD